MRFKMAASSFTPRRSWQRVIAPVRSRPPSIGVFSSSISRHLSSLGEPQKKPLEVYEEMVSQGRLKADVSQREALADIQRLHNSLASYTPPEVKGTAWSETPPESSSEGGGGWFSSMFSGGRKSALLSSSSSSSAPPGLYLYGGVGCGKTMLMDLFYDCVDTDRKRRVHFHAFMLDLHKRMHELRSAHNIKGDPIPYITEEIINESWLLCFDEFQVTDIADALVMRRLFNSLWEKGLVMFCTSNRPPDDLYYNGIQRDLFVPFIHECKDKCHVHHLLSPTDYRLMGTQAAVYISPLNNSTQDFAEKLFHRLTKTDAGLSEKTLELRGRTLTVPQGSFRNGVARFTFEELCAMPKGAEDFIAIAEQFHTVFVFGVPKLSRNSMNQVRRFITLIDALYERRVKAIITADAPPLELLESDGGPEDELFAFDRTVSRLTEMQSLEYLNRAGRKTAQTLKDLFSTLDGSKISSDKALDLWNVYDADLNGEMTVLELENLMRDLCQFYRGKRSIADSDVEIGMKLLAKNGKDVTYDQFETGFQDLLDHVFVSSARDN